MGGGTMHVCVIGSGLVGAELGRRLRAAGHRVTGTTTTPDKVESLADAFHEVRVLRGSDAAAVAEAASGAHAVVVTAGPAAARAMTREDRAATYRDVLVGTAESVVAAPAAPYLVMLSSLSVYGNAADDLDVVDEDSPTTTSDDPSPSNFLAAERTYLDAAADRSVVLRCADIYGAGDPPIEAKVKMAHDVLGGSVPFSGDALFYRVDVADVVDAILFCLQHRPTGVHNLTHGEVPPSNRTVFDAVGAAQGYGPLEFRDELAAPGRPVSVERLAAAGFTTTHTVVAVAPGS
jgi:nucleoside-diphosphate-sugar epimerase